MLAICAYYAGIMLNAFATYYAHNYASIIGSSLVGTGWAKQLEITTTKRCKCLVAATWQTENIPIIWEYNIDTAIQYLEPYIKHQV